MGKKAKVGFVMTALAVVTAVALLYAPRPETQGVGTIPSGQRTAGDVSQGTLKPRSWGENLRNNWITRRVERGWKWKVGLVRSWFNGTAKAQEKGAGPGIVNRPIDFGDARKELTLTYRRHHSDPNAKDILIAPKMIILHYTAGASPEFEPAWRYFNNVHAETARRDLAAAGDVNVSAHFLVDRDGTIYQLMPETWMARHCIGLNHVAIGIENVGDGGKFPLTEAQVESNASLVRYLKGKFPDIQYLIGHSEYRMMERTPLFVERDPKYRNQKGDPGTEFMDKVREQVKDLGLKGTP